MDEYFPVRASTIPVSIACAEGSSTVSVPEAKGLTALPIAQVFGAGRTIGGGEAPYGRR